MNDAANEDAKHIDTETPSDSASESIDTTPESTAIQEVLGDDAQGEAEVESLPNDLLGLIEYRLRNHDRIDEKRVSVRISAPGLIVVSGTVRSYSERLRISELISALPGVYLVRNRLGLDTMPSNHISA